MTPLARRSSRSSAAFPRAFVAVLPLAAALTACTIEQDDGGGGGGSEPPGGTTGASSSSGASGGENASSSGGSSGASGGSSGASGSSTSGSGGTSSSGGGDGGTPEGGAGGAKTYAVSGRLPTPTCTFEGARGEYRCQFALDGATVAPALPPGKTLRDVVDLASQHAFSPPLVGWSDGLSVSRPALPPRCLQTLGWTGSAGLGVTYTVWTKSSAGTECGLAPVSAATFASGFAATVPATLEDGGGRASVSFALR